MPPEKNRNVNEINENKKIMVNKICKRRQILQTRKATEMFGRNWKAYER